MLNDKYIKITDKKKCSGCTACVSICPKKCITMQEDEEGFLYPKVDLSKCVQCSKCIKVCPYTNSEFTLKPETEELALCYAAYNRDEEIRYKSASGGMFRVFADKTIAEGGVVFGAAFDKDFTVYHTYSETFNGLTALMGSKYLQSRMENTFSFVKQFLQDGRKVLFTGCGCQIAGLKRYLENDDENLICIDIICHGVGSPKLWREYLNHYFADYGIKSIICRDKISGWSTSCYTIIGDTKRYSERVTKNPYHMNVHKHLTSRPACNVCSFKNDNRVSDITIADCWGFNQIASEMNDEKGLSSVIVHSIKGKVLFDDVAHQKIVYKDISINDVKEFNSDYIYNQEFDSKKRTAFWIDYKNKPFRKMFEKYYVESKRQKMLFFIKKCAIKIIPSQICTIAKLAYGCRNIQIKSVMANIAADIRFNETFRFGGNKMSTSFKRSYEWRFIVAYRKYQANRDNLCGYIYRLRLDSIERKTGIHIEANPNFGKGLIIGHYGRIIINGNAKFGEQIYITHGVTIGQNATGKRKGAPVIGNRVRIGANVTIVGNVKIGNNVLIAPNAFVNIDIPDHSVVVGNPCQIHYKENATEGYLGTMN